MIGVNMCMDTGIFSNADKLQITEGLTLVYGKDSKSYWYTGLTSVGKDESAVGFVLVDTRTKETTFINKVEPLNLLLKVLLKGKFRRKDIRLHCLFLIISTTFHLCDDAEDDGGLVKMFAMVAISDYDCGRGQYDAETLTSFKTFIWRIIK
jgi:hypothetical protein